MAFKFAILLSFAAFANAGLLPAAHVGAPLLQTYAAAPVQTIVRSSPILTKAVDEYDPHPQYSFAYDVKDSISGDAKSQVESRDGDVVKGQYSLIDADGYQRIVDYTADPVHGFNAIVSRQPLGIKAAPALAYAAAPSYIKAAPLAAAPLFRSSPLIAGPTLLKSAPFSPYASPAIARTSYSSPIVSYAH